MTGLALKSNHTDLKDIADGKREPTITFNDAEYLITKLGYAVVGTVEATVTLHSEDQVIASQLAALQAQLQTVRAEHLKEQNAILDQISKLQAITNDVKF